MRKLVWQFLNTKYEGKIIYHQLFNLSDKLLEKFVSDTGEVIMQFSRFHSGKETRTRVNIFLKATIKKYFDIQIDPDFVKKMSKNIVDYTGLVKKLSSSSTSSFASMLGIDPIQNIANGMVKIAGAYDKLAKAIKSFSSSLNGLDPVKVSSFTRLTGNIAMLSALDSSMFSNMLKVLESKSSVFAKMLDQQAKSEGLGKKGVKGPGGSAGGAIQSKKGDEHGQPKDAKGQTQLQKLDMMIELLTSMNTVIGSGFTLDLYLQEKGSAASAPIGKEK